MVARHDRAAGRYVEVLTLDHYLEVLKIKPGALPGATALAQAKACGAFTVTHQSYWDAARRARGDAAGTRALIEVLLAHRTLPATEGAGGAIHASGSRPIRSRSNRSAASSSSFFTRRSENALTPGGCAGCTDAPSSANVSAAQYQP